MNQRLRPIAAMLLGVVVLVESTTLAQSQPATPKRLMPYRDFIQQVETDKINRVAFSSDRTKATVIQDGQSIEVNLPPDNGLIDRLTRNNVDITVVESPSAQSFWMRSIMSLVVPIVLMSGLLLAVILVTVVVTKNFIRR